MNRFIVNGTDYSSDISGLDQLKLVITNDDETKTIAINFSDEDLTIDGELYAFMEQYFFDDPNGCVSKLPIQIYLDCCKKTYDFEILSGDVNYIPAECIITASISFITPEQEAVSCIRSNPVLNSNQFNSDNLLEVTFDTEARTINGNFATVGIRQYTINSYFEEVAKSCGLTWKSSIFQSGPYANAVYYIGGSSNTALEYDSPVERLNKLEVEFCAEWRIKDGCLFFEPESFYDDRISDTIDLEQSYRDGCLTAAPVYSWDTTNNCAFASFTHDQDDAQSEAARIDYDNYISWLNPNSTNQSGECDFEIPFIPSFFNSSGNLRLENLNPQKPHLLIWDGANTSNADVVQTIDPVDGTTILNHLAQYREDVDGMYTNFFEQKNPINNCKPLVSDITYIPPNFCELFDLLLTIGTDIKLIGVKGFEFVPKTVTVDLSSQTVSFSENRVIT